MNRLAFLFAIGLAGTAILVALGVWQVQRLAWKQALLADMQTRIAAAPAALPAAPDSERDRYLSVRAEGTILPGELLVLVSQKQVGPGFRVIAPFRLADSRTILLDRGFIREDARNEERSLGPADVSGNLHWPDETDSFTPPPDAGAGTWFARDVPAMAAALDTAPLLLVAATQTDPGITPLPVDTAAIPNDHLQYAITWFSLAAIWLAMTARFLWRSRARSST